MPLSAAGAAGIAPAQTAPRWNVDLPVEEAGPPGKHRAGSFTTRGSGAAVQPDSGTRASHAEVLRDSGGWCKGPEAGGSKAHAPQARPRASRAANDDTDGEPCEMGGAAQTCVGSGRVGMPQVQRPYDGDGRGGEPGGRCAVPGPHWTGRRAPARPGAAGRGRVALHSSGALKQALGPPGERCCQMRTRGAPSTACAIRRQALGSANATTHGFLQWWVPRVGRCSPNGLPTRLLTRSAPLRADGPRGTRATRADRS